jgi:hypothetical protein
LKLAYFARWYAKDGTIREAYFDRLRDARTEAEKHKGAEVFKRSQPYTRVPDLRDKRALFACSQD